MKTRAISQSMMEALLSGELQPLLKIVQLDDTLCMELRGDSVSIYYRGGEILQVTERLEGYEILHSRDFYLDEEKSPPERLDVETVLRLLPQYKHTVDLFRRQNRGYTHELQQMIQRENNTRMAPGRTTDYFFLDSDCLDSSTKFDMVAIKWPEKSIPRRKNAPPTLAIIEIIYDNALLHTKKMRKYLSDLNPLLSDTEWVRTFAKDMSAVFSQKCKLGLIHGVQEPLFDTQIVPDTPEVILVFVHQEASSRGVDVLLHQLDTGEYGFPVLVASSSLMGYGMFVERMQPLVT